MNKIIAIYDGCFGEYDESSIDIGIGGSESWTVYLSEALGRIQNTHIIVFCNCNVWHIHRSMPNVEYLPQEMFYNRAEYQKFDAIIISRIIEDNVIAKIKETKCCNNIYIMVHDTIIRRSSFNQFYGGENQVYWENIVSDPWMLENIKEIWALSDWHKKYLMYNSHFPENFIYITRHGLDQRLIDLDCNTSRDNSIFWSNNIYRNFDLLVNRIGPLVKETFPDFKIYFSHYGTIDNNDKHLKSVLNNELVVNLGRLGKTELYNEMIKHKCYFYPLLFPETFCITCVEQALCDVQLVMPLRYGPETIYEPYKYMFMDPVDFSKDDDIYYAASQIINAINTYDHPENIALRKSIKEYFIKKYNWNDIAKELYRKMMIFYK